MKFIKDVFLNFASSIILIMIVQVMFFPIIAREFDAKIFGEYIYIYTIINFFGAVIGGLGNSLYLKYYSSFKEDSKIIEYQKILCGLIIIYILSLPILIFGINDRVPKLEIFYVIFTILLVIYRIYITTWYRAQLKYDKILYGNLIIAITYIILMILKVHETSFYLTLLIAEFSFTFYMIITTRLYGLVLPLKFNKSYLKPFFYLLLSLLAATTFKYIDKWLVESIFSPLQLTYFYIASITSTLFTVPFNTLSSVIFSYFVQTDDLTKGTLIKTILFVIISPILVIISGFIIGPIVIKVLYGQYYELSIDMFYILNIAFGLLSIDYILRGFVVKFYQESIKMLIDVLMLFVLVVLIIIFAFKFGLFATTFAILITFSLKAIINIILLIIYYKSVIYERH